MKQAAWKTGALVAAAAVALWMGFGDRQGNGIVHAEEAAAVTASAGSLTNTITVGAAGSVTVDPDVAYVNVAVESKGASASEAQQANAKAFAAVEKALYETFGIDKKDVQTTGFNVYPEYTYTEKDGRKLVGYTATHAIQVKYRKLAEIGKLLDALSAAGVNRIDGVTFGTEKTDAYEQEALKKAMASAKAKADVLAQSAGRQVKGVLNIVQGTSATPTPFAAAMPGAFAKSAADAATSVQTGQIEITASVTVQYAMK